ncbi:hypothetical protein [Mongoliimonas terrestris]|uniref:hypothetical protein n=1 Tax=Mongoliimonas terrestris TaxID=1709001 RepID=UPI0011154637|nr:hypothetical protein [Mongoliimonas terrestris]
MAKSNPLSRLVEGLRREPGDLKPNLELFADLDPDRVAADLKLVEAGRARGAAELPPSDAAYADEVEGRIVERVEAELKAAHATLTDQLQVYQERLAGLDLEGRFGAIRHAAPAAVSEFRAEAATGRDELHGLRRALKDHEAEKEAFKKRHRLERTPRPPTTGAQALKFGLLAVLLLLETVVNGAFLARGSATGLLGGTTEALAFAVLNVMASFLVGRMALPELVHRNWLRKLVGLIGFLAWLAFAVGLNLALAHYREVASALSGDAGRLVMERLAAAPADLADVKSWLFFAIGFFFSVVALIDGFATVDPYPGFGDLERRLSAARETYIRRKQELIDALLDVRDENIETMEDAHRDLAVRRAEYDAIVAARARLARLFEAHQTHLETTANMLLGLYRTANREARTTPAPVRFDTRYELRRIPLDADVVAPARGDLRQAIHDTQGLLEREVAAVHAAFDQAVAGYHQIDDLFEERPHGAPTT